MLYIFKSSKALEDVFLAILSSAVFAVVVHYYRHWFYFKARYGKIAGNYNGYGYKTGSSTELDAIPISRANVNYIVENRLEITVVHGEAEWVGELTLSTPKHGIIIWQYSDPGKDHIYGFKKCLIQDNNNRIIVIGEAGFGTEVFIRS